MFKLFSKKKKEKIINKGKNNDNQKLDYKSISDTKGKEDDKIWIYEYIYQFLISPYWTNPIQSFIDENSILIEEENEEEIKMKHKEFKSLRDKIISTLNTELNITHKQFENFTEKGLLEPLHFPAFKQLKLIDDFFIFKNILSKRNKELNFEVFENIEKKSKLDLTNEETDELKKAIKESLELQKLTSLQESKEQKELEQTIKLSKFEYEEFLNRLKCIEQETTLITNSKTSVNSEQKTQSFSKAPEKNIFKIKKKNVDSNMQIENKEGGELKTTFNYEEEIQTNVEENKKKGFNKKFKEIFDLKNKIKNLGETMINNNLKESITVFEENKNLIRSNVVDKTSEKNLEDEKKTTSFSEINEKINEKYEIEDIYTRKKRLHQQRDLLLKKKKEIREKYIKNYEKKDEEVLDFKEVELFEFENSYFESKINKSPEFSPLNQEMNEIEKRKELFKKFREKKDCNKD